MPRKTHYIVPEHGAEPDEVEVEEGRGRSARKRAVHELTDLGEQLLTLRPAELAVLALPERLGEAVVEGRRLTSFGAKRRQVLFIGKLIRNLDEELVAAIRKALEKRRG